jgi:hypothetical protein
VAEAPTPWMPRPRHSREHSGAGNTPTIGRLPSGYDANLRWRTSPGAVGYRIFWRDAWTMDWQHELAVGNVNEYVLPSVSIDDYVFGVAAIGPGGHESPIASYVYTPRRYDTPPQPPQRQ